MLALPAATDLGLKVPLVGAATWIVRSHYGGLAPPDAGLYPLPTSGGNSQCTSTNPRPYGPPTQRAHGARARARRVLHRRGSGC